MSTGRTKKIKCTYSSSNHTQCVECFGRGVECISQSIIDQPFVVTRKKNLRERVALLESSIEALRKESESTLFSVKSLEQCKPL
jgi:hypothetical protein